MKLSYTSKELIAILSPIHWYGETDKMVRFISTDTRKLIGEYNGCFFALDGPTRSGNTYLSEAYEKKIRVFVSSALPEVTREDCLYLQVNDPLFALQQLALHHRNQFQIPILAIMGSIGKTTVKEWIYDLIKQDVRVVRSPKSYNTMIGVPLSLLELHHEAELAIIEVGGKDDHERESLLRWIKPTHLLITQFASEGGPPLFSSLNATTWIPLLRSIPSIYCGETGLFEGINHQVFDKEKAIPEHLHLPLSDTASQKAARLAIGFAKEWGIKGAVLEERVAQLTPLAMRLETFLGKNNTLIINDTYNLDMDALKESLTYLCSFGKKRPLGIIVGLDEEALHLKADIEKRIDPFALDFRFVGSKEALPTTLPEDAVVLLKGTRKAKMERYAGSLRMQQHQTKLEINVSSLKHNLLEYKAKLSSETALLVMVKAQSYGSGLDQLFPFFDSLGIAYLGVAYTDEGIALRKKGITLPILVLNPDQESYASCLEYELEPCIGTLKQLDTFIRVVIESPHHRVPVHIEIETGMNRLGFNINELLEVLAVCNAQPEVYIKGVFSHFSDSDNLEDRSFSEKQIALFQEAKQMVEANVTYSVLYHMANSEAIVHYPESHFSMVRLGLGMFGLSRGDFGKRLRFALAWKSVVSQVKKVKKGDRISYGSGFIANRELTIAIIPVGYADGFRRSLSDGNGWVWIQNNKCYTVGKVCMDMMMVDVSHLSNVSEGEQVVIFNDAISLLDLSERLSTIPYEIMTGISSRVQRIFLSD